MTVITAQLNSVRKSPRKVVIVSRELKGKSTDEALIYLQFLGKSSSPIISKLIKSAMANAVNNHNLKADELFIQKIEVLKGGMNKRWKPRSRGMAHPILKRSSHIKVYLTVKEDKKLETTEKEIKKENVKNKLKPKSKEKKTLKSNLRKTKQEGKKKE